MGLNFSQKRLISMARHAKGNSKRVKRLRLYAFLTGIMGLLISLVQLYVEAIR